jgi:MYXO-CTERM domain-containing protein
VHTEEVAISTDVPYGGPLFLVVSEPGLRAVVVDADLSAPGNDISNLVDGVTLSTVGFGKLDESVYAVEGGVAGHAGAPVFGWNDGKGLDANWNGSPVTLRAEFTEFLAQQVSIDYESNFGTVRVEAFDEEGASRGVAIGYLDHMVVRVPEPSGGALALAALFALGGMARRSRSARKG